MPRSEKTRYSGAIPERQHDAFLLALLLAFLLNLAFLVIQAAIPRVSHMIRLLAPEAVEQKPDMEEHYPFVLVDDSLMDEKVAPDLPHHAESTINREARQTAATDHLPEGRPYVEEGVDELLTAPPGNPGMMEGAARQPGEPAAETEPETENHDEHAPDPEPLPEQPEASDAPEPPDASEPVPADAPPASDAPPPAPESAPEPPMPEPIPEQPAPAWTPSPPVEPPPSPAPEPEPSPEPVTPPPDPQPLPDPVEEQLDLAALAVSPDGFIDPQTQLLEEAFRQTPHAPLRPQPEKEQPERAHPHFQPQPNPAALPPQPAASAQPRSRTGRPRPAIRKIGGDGQAGGAPRQRNKATGVKLLDSDPNMRILASRYATYMAKVARQLQESLNRQIFLNPSFYAIGTAGIRFTIAADGSLGYLDTQYPIDGSNDALRRISEATLREAAPFDPPTEEMLRDPLFQKMSLTVFLH